MTLILARIDLASRCVAYINAGHPAGYLLDRFGAVKSVMSSNGLPLGMFDNAAYSCSESHPLEAGDIMVLLTDGITECESPDGRAFGAEGALEIIRAHRAEPAADIVQQVRQATREFAQGIAQADDHAIIIVKVGEVGV